MIEASTLIGSHDVVLITLDSLRYDVAQAAWLAGETPDLASLLPPDGWQRRHSPGTFTLPAHQAFLAGFLPTATEPSGPHRAPRLFAARFERARGIDRHTFVFDEPHLPAALEARGYRTVCLGGVGFFSGAGGLGSVLPGLFGEAHWSRETSVHAPGSALAQMGQAAQVLDSADPGRPLFVLLNVAATHTPTHFYLPGHRRDSPATQRAALRDVDRHLGLLLAAIRRRGSTVLIVCADHGTCFGEDGYVGHGFAHPLVWTVPYLEVVL